MKKLLFVVAVIAISTGAFAQKKKDSKKTGVSFGIQAGINLANVSGSAWTGSGNTANVGLNAGVNVNIPVSGGFSVQGEAAYSQMGAKFTGGKIVLNYIPVTVLAKYMFSGSGFSIFAGPQIGFLATANVKPTGGSNTDVKSSFQSTDFAGAFGVEYQISSVPVFISARYQVGISNTLSTAGGSATSKSTNNAFTALVGYRFGK